MRITESILWTACRALAWILQLAGFAGILLMALIGIWAIAGWIAE